MAKIPNEMRELSGLADSELLISPPSNLREFIGKFDLYLPRPYKKEAPIDFSAVQSLMPQTFEAIPYHLFHGTSLQALDKILAFGALRSGASLRRDGELVWGELWEQIKEMGDRCVGEKYLRPEILAELGAELTEKDWQIFGHAHSIFFAENHLRALGYTPKDPEQKAVLCVNRNALENRGYSLIDCKEEGIKHDGDRINLDFGFSALLVPDSRVDEYRSCVRERYHTTVYPLSDLR